MPPRRLPARPSLDHLRNQAKELLRAHRAGHPSAIARLRESLPHLARRANHDIPQLSPTLRDAQRVIAAEYGFDSWLSMRNHIERLLESTLMFEMTVDHVRADHPNEGQRVVVLKGTDVNVYLLIWIGQTEGDLISMKLRGHEMPRPMTYDLMDSMIADLGARIAQVVLTELRGSTFFANLVLQRNGTTIERDCRPSDAIALAVRCGAPIYATQQVLDAVGIEFDPETGKPVSKHPLWEDFDEIQFDLISDSVQEVFQQAAKGSKSLGHDKMELEDLLRAMVADVESEVAQRMSELGVDVAALRSNLNQG